jgi:hypothetical protein
MKNLRVVRGKVEVEGISKRSEYHRGKPLIV